MSTSPETGSAAADRAVNVLSRWLAGHVANSALREELEAIDPTELGGEAAEAVEEVLAELRDPAGHPGELNMIVREALHALAMGA